MKIRASVGLTANIILLSMASTSMMACGVRHMRPVEQLKPVIQDKGGAGGGDGGASAQVLDQEACQVVQTKLNAENFKASQEWAKDLTSLRLEISEPTTQVVNDPTKSTEGTDAILPGDTTEQVVDGKATQEVAVEVAAIDFTFAGKSYKSKELSYAEKDGFQKQLDKEDKAIAFEIVPVEGEEDSLNWEASIHKISDNELSLVLKQGEHQVAVLLTKEDAGYKSVAMTCQVLNTPEVAQSTEGADDGAGDGANGGTEAGGVAANDKDKDGSDDGKVMSGDPVPLEKPADVATKEEATVPNQSGSTSSTEKVEHGFQSDFGKRPDNIVEQNTD